MLRQKILYNWKYRAPPNYVGRIRSNLSFEVIWRSKKVKNANRFFGCFWQILWNYANLCKSFLIPRRRSSNLVCSCFIISMKILLIRNSPVFQQVFFSLMRIDFRNIALHVFVVHGEMLLSLYKSKSPKSIFGFQKGSQNLILFFFFLQWDWENPVFSSHRQDKCLELMHTINR